MPYFEASLLTVIQLEVFYRIKIHEIFARDPCIKYKDLDLDPISESQVNALLTMQEISQDSGVDHKHNRIFTNSTSDQPLCWFCHTIMRLNMSSAVAALGIPPMKCVRDLSGQGLRFSC
ncbi:hypothetical protein IFM89_014653 [Coptis chinensis]|uniref:Uncharacterized protein n=1 Tax=Coptis chinensis TaxID=261450 RepID=A0A835LH83_9MAGN|nr:hypothetical protein IFM89_014653 [Coptis chinensis]